MQFFSISRRGRRGQNFLGTPQWVFYQPRKNCECARMCTFKNWVLVNWFFWDVFIVWEIANRWRRKCSFQRNMTAHFYIYIESNCFLCGFYSLVIIFLFDKLALTSFSYISKMIYQTYCTMQCTMQKRDDKQRFLIQQVLKASFHWFPLLYISLPNSCDWSSAWVTSQGVKAKIKRQKRPPARNQWSS